MADSQTALLPDGTNRLTKPEIGGSRDTWGNKTNANWDLVSTNLSLVNTTASGALPKAGGTSTGKQIFNAGIRLAPVTANPSPAGDGDMWFTSTSVFVSLNSVTKQLIDSTGGTFTGFVTLHAAPTADMHASTKLYVDGRISNHTHTLSQLAQSGATSGQVATWNGTAWVAQTPATSGGTTTGVTSFNTRTGAVTLSSTDVTTALGFTPVGTTGFNTTGDIRVGTTTAISGADRLSVYGGTSQDAIAARVTTSGKNLFSGYGTGGTKVISIADDGTITAPSIVSGNGTAWTTAKNIFTSSSDWAVAAYSTSAAGAIAVRTNATSSNLIGWYYNATNIANIVNNGTSVSYNTTSDYRLKQDIADYSGGLSVVKALRPVTFKWKADLNGPLATGFIAHEVQAVIPQAINGEKDAVDANGNIKPQGIDNSFIVPHLVAAVKELEARVAQLENA